MSLDGVDERWVWEEVERENDPESQHAFDKDDYGTLPELSSAINGWIDKAARGMDTYYFGGWEEDNEEGGINLQLFWDDPGVEGIVVGLFNPHSVTIVRFKPFDYAAPKAQEYRARKPCLRDLDRRIRHLEQHFQCAGDCPLR